MFAALLAPDALSLLTTTFTDPNERGKAFGVYGAIAGGGGLVGLLLGGVLTEYLDWRWCLYVNLLFAGPAVFGGVVLLQRHGRRAGPLRLDMTGVVTGSAAMFCLVYGFANAATHNWTRRRRWGFLAAGVLLLIAFAAGQARAAHPLLPPRVGARPQPRRRLPGDVRRRSGDVRHLPVPDLLPADILGYSPVITGLAFLPPSAC